jgi:hypothetical protein
MLDTVNPYHAEYGDARTAVTAPFAGRQEAFARLYTRLYDPIHTGAILFLGGRHSGKTALLHNADSVFKETALGVYVPLCEIAPENESEWLLALAQAATSELMDRGFTLSRLSQLDPPGDDPRAWLETTFLPQILGAVRRKLLLLLDDVDRLIMAVRGGQLPEDTFAYLLSLTQKYRNLHIAATLDAEFEADIPALAPLVAASDVVRLTTLSPDESRWLLQAPVHGLYTVPDECALAVHRAVGGAAGLVQHFGYQFFQRWEAFPELNVFTLADVRALTTSIYLYSEPDYRYLWERLSANERLVLTAISGLLYDDPLGHIDAAVIQGWLVETDFPLDLTAINSTLRSLEYRELLRPTPNGIALSAEIMQTWLLENARLGARLRNPPPTSPAKERPQTRITPRLLRVLLVIFILLVIANVIAYAWVNSGTPSTPSNIQPTVTFANTP